MWAIDVVIRSPPFDLAHRVVDRQELHGVQAFSAQLAVERLNEAVFRRFPRADKVKRHAFWHARSLSAREVNSVPCSTVMDRGFRTFRSPDRAHPQRLRGTYFESPPGWGCSDFSDPRPSAHEMLCHRTTRHVQNPYSIAHARYSPPAEYRDVSSHVCGVGPAAAVAGHPADRTCGHASW